MKFTLSTFIVAAILGLALASIPVTVSAQSTPPPAAKATKPAKAKAPQYHGTVKAVDAAAGTLTVDAGTKKDPTKTLDITVPATAKITKDGKVATLADLAVGEKVGGSYTTDAAGKNTATSVVGHSAKTAKK